MISDMFYTMSEFKLYFYFYFHHVYLEIENQIYNRNRGNTNIRNLNKQLRYKTMR